MKSVRRWVYLINIIRALPYLKLHGQMIVINNKELLLVDGDNNTLEAVENETGKVFAIFSEDGQPDYLNDWMKESVEWDCYDFPMYEM